MNDRRQQQVMRCVENQPSRVAAPMRLRRRVALAVSCAAFVLGGCSFIPHQPRPDAPVATSFPDGERNDDPALPRAIDTGWRDFFRDPRLQALIEAALSNNRDLRTAALRIEESRALYNIQQADLLPNVGVIAGATRARSLIPQTAASPRSVVGSTYQVGLSLTSFELDFFGRVRALNASALASYLATTEAQQSAQISLIAAVAQANLTERSYAEQLELARSTEKTRQSAYALAKQRFDVGASSALDLRLAESIVLQARVAAVTLARQRAQAFNALTLLVGQPLTELPPSQALSSENLVSGIPAGLPSDLLTNRPDIRAAEQRLRAANANIGAARAAFFPRISLTAALGAASTSLSGLFDSGSGTWSFGPQLLLPIFDAGRNQANLTLAQVRTSLAVTDYEKTIQVAFREVADALAARGTLEEQVVAQQQFLEAQADRLRLAELRRQNGVASSLDVLDAQREVFNAQQSLVQTRLQRLTNAVDLYRSLGGGINERTIPQAAR